MSARLALSPVLSLALALGGGALDGAPVRAEEPIPEGEWSIPAPLAAASLLVDAVRRGDLVVAVGERGHVLLSRDDGASWSQARVPSRALLTAVWMHDERLGWVVGHDETILRTRDGGTTWERVRHEPDNERPLLDVWFADENRGLAVGAYGVILATADGGDSWAESRIEEDDFHLNHVAAVGSDLYLAAEAGNLYHSGDGGESWRRLESPYIGSFFGMQPLEDGALLAFGLRGNLFRSEDRGGTWTAVETGTVATLTDAVDLGGGRIAVVGLAGAVLRSSDGGRTFRGEELPDNKGASAVLARRDGRELMLFGEGGVRRIGGEP